MRPSDGGRASVLRYEAQPTRMFGSYSVTAHLADGTADAVAYGSLDYCRAEAERLNDELSRSRDSVRRP